MSITRVQALAFIETTEGYFINTAEIVAIVKMKDESSEILTTTGVVYRDGRHPQTTLAAVRNALDAARASDGFFGVS
jgi:hypothetical protein